MIMLDKQRERRNELKAQRETVLSAMESLAEDAERSGRSRLTSDETLRFDGLKAQIKAMDAELKDLDASIEELDEVARRAGAAGKAPTSTGGDATLTFWRQRDPWGDHGPAELRERRDLVAQAKTALERTTHMADERRQAATVLLERQEAIENVNEGHVAQWMTTLSAPAYLEAFRKTLADPTRGHQLWDNAEREAVVHVGTFLRAMSNTDANGGYLSLPLALDPAIRIAGAGGINALAGIANTVVMVNTDTYRLPYSTEVAASYDAEAAVVSDDSTTIAASDIKAHRQTAFIPASIEVSEDPRRFADKMTTLLVDSFDVLDATAFMTGSGSDQPYGLITRMDASTGVEVVVTTSGTYDLAQLHRLEKALPARFRLKGSDWLMHLGYIQKTRELAMAQASANSIWNELDAAQPPRLLGHSLHEATAGVDDVVTGTSVGNICVIGHFADLYTIVRRAPTMVEVIPHLFDPSTARPTGQRGYFAMARTGGDTVVLNAGRMLNNT